MGELQRPNRIINDVGSSSPGAVDRRQVHAIDGGHSMGGGCGLVGIVQWAAARADPQLHAFPMQVEMWGSWAR